jgi:hypothetical protein
MIQMYIKKTVFLYETEEADKMKRKKYEHELQFSILSSFLKKKILVITLCD